MILKQRKTKENRLRYLVEYSQPIEGYILEDQIAGYYSKDLIEVKEILRVIKDLPPKIRQDIVKRVLIEDYRHIYIIKEIYYNINLQTNIFFERYWNQKRYWNT